MKKKKHKPSPTGYQRYECVLAIEGPVDPAYLHRLLTGGNAQLDERLRSDAVRQGRTYKPVGGPYTNILKQQVAGSLVLLSHKDVLVNVFNGQTHLSQRLLCVYRASGTISDAEVSRLERSGEYIVDFRGRIDFLRDDNGKPLVRKINGRIKKEVCEGEVIFVRDADPAQPPETAFLVDSLDHGETRIVRPPLFAQIDPEWAGFTRIALSDTSTSNGIGATDDKKSITVAIDAAGELIDGFMPDGGAVFSVGPHDHVVLLLEEHRRVVTGTKAEFVRRYGILDSLETTAPEMGEMYDRLRNELADCDPSDGFVLVTIPAGDGMYSVRTIPQSAIPPA